MPEVGRGVVIPSATSQTLDIAIAAPSPSVLLADVTLDTVSYTHLTLPTILLV